MEQLICCCGSRSWTRVIAWIQIFIYAFGLLLAGGGLIAILVAGKEAVDRATQENSYPIQADTTYSDWNTLGISGYLQLVVALVISLIVLVLGIILGVFLLKGANEGNIRYLKWWTIHAVVCLVWSLVSSIVGAEGTITLIVRLSIFCTLYGFCIWVVMTLIKEIEMEQGLNGRRDEPPGHNYKTDKSCKSFGSHPIKV